MKGLQKCGLAAVVFGIASLGQAEPLKVVASFSVLGDLVEQVAGDRVSLNVLVGPNGDTHVYEPSPQDAVAISRADLVVVNGLSFEGWMPRLMETADFTGDTLTLGEHIDPLPFDHEGHEGHEGHKGHKGHESHKGHEEHHEHEEHKDHEEHEHHEGASESGHHHHHGEFDPHTWHSLPHMMTYVSVITDKLAALDPDNAAYYRQRSEQYQNRLSELHHWARDEFDAIPESRRRFITPHDAFGYLAHEYGLHIESPQGLSTESEASAKRLGDLILQVRMNNITAVFLENIASDQLVRQIERETKVTFGGTLYSGALSESSGPAATYEAMMRHNLDTVLEALRRPDSDD